MPNENEAIKLREENISNVISRKVKKGILKKLEQLMRENPYGRAFLTAGERIKQFKETHGEKVPDFQVMEFYYYFNYFNRSFC